MVAGNGIKTLKVYRSVNTDAVDVISQKQTEGAPNMTADVTTPLQPLQSSIGMSGHMQTVSNTKGLKVSIPWYILHRNDRGSRHGGGMALYVRSDLSHEPCPDVNKNIVAEVCWIKVTLPHTKPVIIGTMYRPPSKNQDYFNASLDRTEEASAQGNGVVILGDLNCNYVHGDPQESCTLEGTTILYDSDYQRTHTGDYDFIYYHDYIRRGPDNRAGQTHQDGSHFLRPQ